MNIAKHGAKKDKLLIYPYRSATAPEPEINSIIIMRSTVVGVYGVLLSRDLLSVVLQDWSVSVHGHVPRVVPPHALVAARLRPAIQRLYTFTYT